MDSAAELAKWIDRSSRIVFFGGAGVSTESQIPDFRGPHGLYKQKLNTPWTPEEMLSHHFFEEHTKEFFENYDALAETTAAAKPNQAHYALTALEKMGKLLGIVTQNIDGLHQKAGSKHVMELHGTVMKNTCLQCGKQYNLEQFLKLANPVPHCPDCGGIIKPDVVLYEEPLNLQVLKEAVQCISEADLLIVGGTSLVVYPAAGLIDYCHGPMIMINQDPTSEDSRCALVIHDSIGKVLGEAVRQVQQKK